MINERFFLGESIQFKQGVNIFPPKVKDIVTPSFGIFKSLLTLSQEQIEDIYLEEKKDEKYIPTPFEYLMGLVFNDPNPPQYRVLISEAFKFFTHQEATVLPEQKIIILGDLKEKIQEINSIDELITIKEDEYFNFQNLLRESIGEKPVEKPDPNEHPKIKAMKAKARYRDKIKAKKSDGINLGTSLAAICCMGIGITPLNIGEITYVCMNSLIRTYQEKEKYDIDVRSLQAGAKAKDVNLKYWIRNLND